VDPESETSASVRVIISIIGFPTRRSRDILHVSYYFGQQMSGITAPYGDPVPPYSRPAPRLRNVAKVAVRSLVTKLCQSFTHSHSGPVSLLLSETLQHIPESSVSVT